ncbi:MAG TPA: serine/threonine-protein kinase [Kofleriaceae bacterium]|nr:serine/threonine-protein kinase [Kofleriaceae bacterium]
MRVAVIASGVATHPLRSSAPTIAEPITITGPARELVAPSPGERLGRYIVLRTLGTGGMGTVVAAHDPELDRSVAIKVVRAGFWTHASDAARAQLRREAQAMARLTHPNVVAVHDVGAHGDHLFVAMQLVPGSPLDHWLRRPRTWHEILAVCLQAGRGLAAAHAAGLVHRDIKPGNILVDGEGTARIADFGLAVPGAASDEQAACGTPAYMALEQHRGVAADARSDQFAFAVTMFEALFGRRPYAGESKQAIADAIAAGRIETIARRGVPRHVVTALARALAADARDRFSSMEELLDALAVRPRARRIAAVAAGVVAAVGLVLGAARTSGAPSRHTGDAAGAYAALVADADEAVRDGRLGEADAALRSALRIASRANLGDEAAQAWSKLVGVLAAEQRVQVEVATHPVRLPDTREARRIHGWLRAPR